MAKQSVMQSPYLVVPLKYGSVGGILSILLIFILPWFGENPLIRGNLFSFFFVPIFVFFSVKEFKKYYNGGYLHFWQGMSIGFLTYTMLALLSAIFIWIYLETLNPGVLQEYISDRIQLMTDSKVNLVERLGEATFEQSLKSVQLTTAFDMAVDDFIRKIAIGFFITSIISVIMRQQPLTKKTN